MGKKVRKGKETQHKSKELKHTKEQSPTPPPPTHNWQWPEIKQPLIHFMYKLLYNTIPTHKPPMQSQPKELH